MMFKDKLFDGTSKAGRFVFQTLLSGLGSPFRKRINNPVTNVTVTQADAITPISKMPFLT